VTIIAGFKCYGGVVLCADTQETIGDISKRNVPKLRFEPRDADAGSEIAVAFCGATTNGPFMDEIVDRAWEDVQAATALDEACAEINKSIKKSYKDFGHIYQPGFCPTAELIYGIKMSGGSKMFHAYGPAINEKTDYASGGIGCYLADFLVNRMRGMGLSLRQCIILAAYVLFQAKEYVDGCGGDSQIAVLRDDGTSGLVDWGHVDVLNKLIQQSDSEISKLVMHYADFDLSNDEFLKKGNEELGLLMSLRSHDREALEKWKGLYTAIVGGFRIDSYGLPASDSESDSESDKDQSIWTEEPE
jgi:20S proteasome alpha/beta subunit